MKSAKAVHKILIVLTAVFAVSTLFICVKTAQAKTNGYGSAIKDIYVRLSYGNNIWEYRYPDICYDSGLDSQLDKNFEKDFRGRLARQKAPLICSYILNGAKEKVEDIAKAIDIPPENAEVVFSPDSEIKFELKNDVTGKKVDTAKLLREIENCLKAGKSADIQIVPENTEAEFTAKSLKRSFNVRGQFSTGFSNSSPERKHNIALSLSCFNGMIIPPDTEISFNRTVGRRTEARGYKTAKIIVGGDFIEGLGGGVCQTSTTLYNALLLADVKITEQHKHSLAVSYVPPSFDAMVNISTADLKFKNDTGNFLYLKTWTENNRAYVRIYGENTEYKIVRKSTVTKTYETPREKLIKDTEGLYKDIYEGEKVIVIHSKPKTESIGELLYYKNGKLVKTVLIRKDIYSQLVGKEILGTAKRQK